jgi:hypothetical protein
MKARSKKLILWAFVLGLRHPAALLRVHILISALPS